MQPDTKQRKPAMEVRDLFFSYGKNKVLKGTSFAIEEGKITTIMGANGCGKSTLFNLMTKNLCPRKGNIFLHGKNIQNLGLKDFAKRVSIVHQYNSSADDITVERLVSFGRTPHRKMMQGHSDEDEKLIRRADEPTTYLDIRYQIEILELVKKLNQEYGITIIMVLHDINQAIHFSDRIIGLKDGQVAVHGAPEAVITEECIRELYGISLGVTVIEGKKFVLTV